MTATAFHDLPADEFPLTIEFIAEDTRDVLHTIEVAGPGAVQVPAFHPRRVSVRVTLSNWVQETNSAGVSVCWERRRS